MLDAKNLRPADPSQSVVLVVEDEVAILNVARIALEREGYFVLTADNGEAALHLSRIYPGEIHMLVTDIKMPLMGGVELTRRISVERPKTQIVLMSGNITNEEIDPRYLFLAKPFGPRKLTDAVKELVPVRQEATLQ
jgi:two-component system, cell cycle sensor histidine kinase and response regulator CckA